jgi:hypothetical protein
VILRQLRFSQRDQAEKTTAPQLLPMNATKRAFPSAKELTLALLLTFPMSAHAAPPDLTAAGVIATIDRSSTYNLGPTGMRGWIHISRSAGGTQGDDGTMTDESRQILVTVASTPASAQLQVNDVILGVDWGSGTGAIPAFTSDARKAFGNAITQAEKAENNGILRIKRWRAGVTTDVSITLTVMGSYTETAPYSCPKSSLVLANARNNLVGKLIADSNYLSNGSYSSAIHALALLAGVQPGDPNYATVQTRLQTYARAIAAAPPPETGLNIWPWGYNSIFLAEYYLRTVADGTPDTTVLPGIHAYALKLAQSQSVFGTFGHGPAVLRPDGSGRMSVAGYGPVNSAGVPANLGIVMLRKALLAGSQTIDPQIDTAIQRGSDFFAWYVNKGSIPYGEHHPGAEGFGSNGKNTCAAVFFSQLDNRPAETEYYTRASVSNFLGREYGHTGQGFSYLWEGMGANVGGPLAVAEYFKPVRWHLDLTRRTDGSFAYDGEEQYGGGSTTGNTYLGATDYNGLDSTASLILSLSVPLQRLHITGRNANPAHTLDSTKVANAIAAATYKFDRLNRNSTQLIADLGEYDPVVRNFAAKRLAAITLIPAELDTLRTMLSGPNANERMGACQTLGLRKDATAKSMITQRLNKITEPDPWVRGMAADALRDYGTDANSEVNTMLSRFVANSADPDTIVWSDPLQASNGKLSWALFDTAPGTGYFDFGATVIGAQKSLLYPAVSTGFKHPDSAARQAPGNFAFSRMPIADVQALPNDFINLVLSETQCDRMWSSSGRHQGIRLLSKYKFIETMPLALAMLDVPEGFEWGSADYLDRALTEIASYGESARWALPTLRSYLGTWENGSSTRTALVNAINSIEAATTSPTSPYAITYLKAAANKQVVTTAAGVSKAITLTGSSCREASVSFLNVTQPAHGTLIGTAPDLTYIPNAGYTGPDQFTFQTADTLTTSEPATIGIVIGTAGNGLKGEYFDNSNFTNPVHTRTDAQVNFDWGTGSPHASVNADTFSVRWSGLLLVPETCAYTFSALSNDGVRLYLNGVPLIDSFVDQNTKWKDSAPIQLTKGQLLEIQMDYYENTGSAAAKLKWTGPSVAGQTGAIIPQAYLYDGTGMPRTLFAFPQSLVMSKNISQAITLVGSAGTVSYSIVTPPAHGTLSGAAPNLTYTPFANYVGLDSFTFKTSNGTIESAPAAISIEVIPANTFGVNFYAYGALNTPEAQANLLLNPGMSAGHPDWFTYGWANVEVPWGGGLQPPLTLASNRGSTATFVFKDCRNGGPYNWSVPRTTLLGDGNGNMMDGHVNSTLDGPSLFDMEVTGIPFAVYDVIFYMGANKDQYGNGAGVIKFNGGADRSFTLKSGAFNGTFIEMVNATTPGNYIIFSGVTGSSFTAQTWGLGNNGFNHIGPCGFQIRESVVVGPTTTTLVSSPAGTASYGAPVTFTASSSGSGIPATGMVTFRNGGTVLDTVPLSSGEASFTTSALALASHSITATYEGNGSFGGSVSPPLAYVVTPKALTVTGVTAGNKIYDGNAAAALTGGTLSGAINGETVTLVPGGGTFANTNVGTWAVTASGYTLSGTHAGNYQLFAQPAVPNATISPRPVQITGTRVYNGTTLAPALTVANTVGGDDLALIGSANVGSANVGTQALAIGFATPVRVRSSTGNTGTNTVASFTVTMSAAPAIGNTLVAVITTRGNSANRVNSISQAGVTWTKASGAEGINTNATSGSTTEIWYGKSITAGVGTVATIAFPAATSLRAAAVIAEYSGVLLDSPLDKTSSASGNSATASTGTSAATTQTHELWIGGIGFRDSSYNLGTPTNGFTTIASANSTNGTTNTNAKANFLEKIVSATGIAGSSGSVTSSRWSGAIATFKAASTNSLSLSGSAAGNYTLNGMTGSVTITAKNLGTTGLSASNKIYDGSNSAALAGSASLLASQAAGAGNSSDGKPYTGDALTLSGTPAATFADKHVGSNKPVTVTGITLGGAQAANYFLTQPSGLTANIAALPVTVAAVHASKTYDGNTNAPGTPTINPALASGDTATLLSQTYQTPGAGNANKVLIPAIILNDGNNGANHSVTLQNFLTGTISQAPATVTLGDLTATWSGTPKAVSVATSPTGLTTQVTYNGSPTPPTDAGSYAVVATITDPNHAGSATDTLVIIADLMTIWRNAHFSAGEITAGLADDTANADGDDFNNLEEYIMGTDPRAFSQPPLAVVPAAGNQYTLSFTASRASGAGYAGRTRIYTVESTADPATAWQPLTGYTDITGNDQAVSLTVPVLDPKRFHRLKVRIE